MRSATFTSRFARACFTLVLLAVLLLGAQTRGNVRPQITVDVPFDFMVRQTMFPAGDYTVALSGDRTFYLRASHGREAISIVVESLRTAPAPSTARLIFSEEDGHYRLRQLWLNSATGGELPPSPVQQLRTVSRSLVEVPARCTNCK